GGTGEVLAATGAPVAGGLVGGILFLLGGLGLRKRRR
ncbi:MAG: LPXTG cell wall anchor domain-containing protein, partial [Chloroflexi bacterium]